MARLAQVVIAGMPHQVPQRGNRRQETFFNDGDYAAYMELMADGCREEGVEIWCYCLMPNHIHLIAVPRAEESLPRAIGEAHRRYPPRINFREKWRGYVWQGRFASFVMSEVYLLTAARYVELNPLPKLFPRNRTYLIIASQLTCKKKCTILATTRERPPSKMGLKTRVTGSAEPRVNRARPHLGRRFLLGGQFGSATHRVDRASFATLYALEKSY